MPTIITILVKIRKNSSSHFSSLRCDNLSVLFSFIRQKKKNLFDKCATWNHQRRLWPKRTSYKLCELYMAMCTWHRKNFVVVWLCMCVWVSEIYSIVVIVICGRRNEKGGKISFTKNRTFHDIYYTATTTSSKRTTIK